ncbi:unnamed protein product [Notodromas monacha]|uniref:Brain tumor protein n=1 Tax=Notodromas monacha TaxID=399045 RepID=A0A7R9GCD0_9CRUS|nr:unnamed protein product [Notodromas monacha]CAG0915853.1 unnamed protein product [Notodromas monacha]
MFPGENFKRRLLLCAKMLVNGWRESRAMASSPSPSLDSFTGALMPVSSSLESGSNNSSLGCLDLPSSVTPKCFVCNDELERPRVLHCLHSFCSDCIEKLVEADKVSCPKCCADTVLPSSGVSGLVPDYLAVTALEPPVIDTNAVSCTGCKGKESNAVARCYDCAHFLCANCVMAHQYMHCFEGHTYYLLNELQNGAPKFDDMKLDKPVWCLNHKNEALKYFCRTCNTPICKDCTLIEHPKGYHEYESLVKVSSSQIEEMSRLVQEAKMKFSDMDTALKNVDHVCAKLQLQYQKAQDDVNATFAFAVSALEERKKDVLRELESTHNSKQNSLANVAKKVEETVRKIHQVDDFMEKMLKFAAPAHTLMFKKVIESMLMNAINFCPDIGLQNASELEFVSNYQAIQTGVQNTFGYIRSSPDIQLGTNKQPPIARPANGFISVSNNAFSSFNSGPFSISNSICDQRSYGNGHVSPFDTGLQLPPKRYNGLSAFSTLGESLLNGSGGNSYEKWSNGGSNTDTLFPAFSDSSSPLTQTPDPVLDLGTKLITAPMYPPKSHMKRQKMIYHCKFGEFGVMEGQFTEPSGVAVNKQSDIIVADTNNHRIQIFDKEGRFKFQFGECGKRDGQLLYPNRVAVVQKTGDIVVTERSPTHQIQIYTQYGQFVRKFGANILQHPRGVTVDSNSNIIVVECKVMRVIIFDILGNVLHKFGCSKHLEFPNGVVVNDREEIFISDNRAHCVKVFSFDGAFLRQIGGEGITNYPIGVGINAAGEILVADNHNNFNLTIFTQDGQCISALESKVKHAQCFDVALMNDGSVVLASKDYRLYVYRYAQAPPVPLCL